MGEGPGIPCRMIGYLQDASIPLPTFPLAHRCPPPMPSAPCSRPNPQFTGGPGCEPQRATITVPQQGRGNLRGCLRRRAAPAAAAKPRRRFHGRRGRRAAGVGGRAVPQGPLRRPRRPEPHACGRRPGWANPWRTAENHLQGTAFPIS